MGELMNDAAEPMVIATVCLAALSVSIFYLVRSQRTMVRTQVEMLFHLSRIGTLSLNDAETTLLDGGWRKLSDDDQRKLKAALLVLLAQMDGSDLNPN